MDTDHGRPIMLKMVDNLRKWTREEYRQAAEVGIIRSDERLELLDGQFVQKTTQNPPRVLVIGLLEDWLRTVVGPELNVRSQLPVALSDMSEPEPDLAVVHGSRRNYETCHPVPAQVELIVEVYDSSIDRDRRVKAPLYAAAGIKELWIVDVVSRKLEVHREPASAGYRVVTIRPETESIAPLFNANATIQVAVVLPSPE